MNARRVSLIASFLIALVSNQSVLAIGDEAISLDAPEFIASLEMRPYLALIELAGLREQPLLDPTRSPLPERKDNRLEYFAVESYAPAKGWDNCDHMTRQNDGAFGINTYVIGAQNSFGQFEEIETITKRDSTLLRIV